MIFGSGGDVWLGLHCLALTFLLLSKHSISYGRRGTGSCSPSSSSSVVLGGGGGGGTPLWEGRGGGGWGKDLVWAGQGVEKRVFFLGDLRKLGVRGGRELLFFFFVFFVGGGGGGGGGVALLAGRSRERWSG